MKTIIGILKNRSTADNLVESIQDTGVPIRDITLLMPGESVDLGEIKEAAESADGIAASPRGAITGGAIGIVAGLGALAIPGFVPLVLVGAGVAGLSAVVAGGAVGILGALLGSSVPESNLSHYQHRLHDGGYLIAARVGSEELATRLHGEFVTGGADDIIISPDLVAAS